MWHSFQNTTESELLENKKITARWEYNRNMTQIQTSIPNTNIILFIIVIRAQIGSTGICILLLLTSLSRFLSWWNCAFEEELLSSFFS